MTDPTDTGPAESPLAWHGGWPAPPGAGPLDVLVVGSGGREHALCQALARSARLGSLWCAPGNAGTSTVATPIPVAADDVDGLVAAASEHGIDLVVVGPEAPLAAGLADALIREGIAVVGPTAAAARLEASKSFAREVMDAAGVPCAAGAAFTDPAHARAWVEEHAGPAADGSPERGCVVKLDGLAAGKGVTVASSVDHACQAVERAYAGGAARIVCEQRLAGTEASLMVLVDAAGTIRPLPMAQDHKRLLDGDRGPNTGGMGATSPVWLAAAPGEAPLPADPGSALVEQLVATVIEPVVGEMARRGTPFCGVLYAGLMLTSDGPRVLEYNVRLGDPEAQVVLARLASDPLELLAAVPAGTLADTEVAWSEHAACCVVGAAPGYPDAPQLGSPLVLPEDPARPAAAAEASWILHAGTERRADGTIVTSGGRVIAAMGRGVTADAARAAAYGLLGEVELDGIQYRRDIGRGTRPPGRAPAVQVAVPSCSGASP